MPRRTPYPFALVVLNTTFAAHGRPLATRRPAKKNTAEADSLYYK
jgi:hypothetical protein